MIPWCAWSVPFIIRPAHLHRELPVRRPRPARPSPLPLPPQLFANRASCSLQLGKFREAVADADLAATFSKAWAKPLKIKADALLKLGSTEEAIEVCEAVLAIDAADADAKDSLSKALAQRQVWRCVFGVYLAQ